MCATGERGVRAAVASVFDLSAPTPATGTSAVETVALGRTSPSRTVACALRPLPVGGVEGPSISVQHEHRHQDHWCLFERYWAVLSVPVRPQASTTLCVSRPERPALSEAGSTTMQSAARKKPPSTAPRQLLRPKRGSPGSRFRKRCQRPSCPRSSRCPRTLLTQPGPAQSAARSPRPVALGLQSAEPD